MKKSALILISFLCFKVFSQSSITLTQLAPSATISANTTVVATTTVGATTTIDFDVTNNSTATKSYIVKRYDIILNSVASTSTIADAYFCFAGNCYPSTTTVSAVITLTANQSASQVSGGYNILTTDLYEASSVGYSLIKYSVINTANTNDSLQFSLKYDNSATSIAELNNNSLSAFDLFPNPATDVTVLKVNSQKSMDAKVIIYNALGAIVSEKPVTILEGKNKIEVNVSDLSAGVYFTQIKMGSGIVTKKLIVK